MGNETVEKLLLKVITTPRKRAAFIVAVYRALLLWLPLALSMTKGCLANSENIFSTLLSHSGDTGNNGHIVKEPRQVPVVQLVRTYRLHRRGHSFEFCQDHKELVILLEITVYCQNKKSIPLQLGMVLFV